MYSGREPTKASARKLYVLTPKNKTEQKRIEREIKKTGTYKANYTIAEQEISMSPITETELELGPFILWEHKRLAHAREGNSRLSEASKSGPS